MDLLTLAGVLLGGAAIVFGFALEGGHFSMLFQFEALIIVLGGTLGAVMIQNTWARFFDAVKQLRLAFVRAREVDRKNLSDLLEWGDRAKLDGLLAFESMDVSGIHPFARRGLELLANGVSTAVLEDALQRELDAYERSRLAAARVWQQAGGYAPTFGILGSVLGLVQVTSHMLEPAQLGPGIAVAFIATLYGLAFANLVFLPLYGKLRAQLAVKRQEHEVGERQPVQRRDERNRDARPELRRFEHMARHLHEPEHRPENAERRRIAARLLPHARSGEAAAFVGIEFALQRVFEHGGRYAVRQQFEPAARERMDAAHVHRFECKQPVELRAVAPFEQVGQVLAIDLARTDEREPQLLHRVKEARPRVLDHHRAERAAEHNDERLELEQHREMPAFQRETEHDRRTAQQHTGQGQQVHARLLVMRPKPMRQARCPPPAPLPRERHPARAARYPRSRPDRA